VRVIAATNRDLRFLVGEGRFLRDLFYRLHVVPITVPPLRDRREDIPMLVEYFLRRHAALCGKTIRSVDDGAMSALVRHSWPGNVRELEHTIERAVVLATGPVITPDAVMIDSAEPDGPGNVPSLQLRDNVEWAERETIRRALGIAPIKRRAAQLMGISPRALSHYLTKYPQINRGPHSGE
jgi:two-component system response regulator AtoC